MDVPFARAKEAFDARQEKFDSALTEIQPDLDYARLTCDPYDNSIEFYEVPNDVRLTSNAVAFLKAEGFSMCWLNHADGWETLYHLANGTAWRKRQWKRKLADGSPDPSGLIELEERCESWPVDWYESGYVTVVPSKGQLCTQ